MFEKAENLPATPASVTGATGTGGQGSEGARVIAPEGEPLEFMYKGRRFHVHSIVSRWRESGGWWNRIDDGRLQKGPLEDLIFDDGGTRVPCGGSPGANVMSMRATFSCPNSM